MRFLKVAKGKMWNINFGWHWYVIFAESDGKLHSEAETGTTDLTFVQPKITCNKISYSNLIMGFHRNSPLIQPILLLCSPCFYTTFSITNREKNSQKSLTLHPKSLIPALQPFPYSTTQLSVTTDSEPPLHPHFTLLPSGRRYRTVKWRRARFS